MTHYHSYIRPLTRVVSRFFKNDILIIREKTRLKQEERTLHVDNMCIRCAKYRELGVKK